jgi:hypothetical protein
MLIKRELAIKIFSTHLRGLSPAVMILMALIILSTLAVSARAWLRPAATVVEPAVSPLKATSPAQPPPAPQGNSKHQALEAEIVTLRPFGFEPAEIARPKGRFILMVDNRSGLGDMDLQLNRETGNHLHAVKVSKEQLDWNDEFDLSPGRYVLTEAGHPEWSCWITITAK